MSESPTDTSKDLDRVALQTGGHPTVRNMVAGSSKACVFLPFAGEFGHFIMTYIRFVHFFRSPKKIVCCRRGEEPYFPSAAGFFYGWSETVPDAKKHRTSYRDRERFEDRTLIPRVRAAYGDCECVDAPQPLPTRAVAELAFSLAPARRRGLSLDVVLGARRRDYGRFRNFDRWDEVADALAQRGHRVGVVGNRETSCPVRASTLNSWDYDDASAVIEMMQGCRLFIGTDTGTSHLAAFCSVPMIVFKCPDPTSGIAQMRAATRSHFEFLEDGWDNPPLVVERALGLLEGRSPTEKPGRPASAVEAIRVEDVSNRNEIGSLLDALGCRTGVELGVFKGEFSRHLLERSHLSRLYSVDSWAYRNPQRWPPPGDATTIAAAAESLQPFGDRSVMIRTSSWSAAELFADGSIDFVYIDADHSYEPAACDLRTWWPKLRPGGLFAGHDYHARRGCGVKRAVDEFAARLGLSVHSTRERRLPSWLLRKPDGVSDLSGHGAGPQVAAVRHAAAPPPGVPEFTLVAAVDEVSVNRLRLTWPTWMRFKPLLRTVPVVLIHDARLSPDDPRLQEVRDHPRLQFVPWRMDEAESQRERMLTAFVKVPAAAVRTPWYLKLDADAVAVAEAEWPRTEWFQPDSAGRRPVFVASPWGYTKPADFLSRLDDWADGVPGLRERPRLNIPCNPGHSRVRHRRITSWCFFGDTRWTGEMAACAPGRLPVPSHDTYLFYCAARRGDRWVRARMACLGWEHISRFGRMRERCREVMQVDAQPAAPQVPPRNSS